MKTTILLHNQLDTRFFEETINQSTILSRYLDQGDALFSNYHDLMLDVFLLLYKMNLILTHREEGTINAQLVMALKENPTVGKLRNRTKGNVSATYLALKMVLDSLLEQVRGRISLHDWAEDLERLADLQDQEDHLLYLETICQTPIEEVFSQEEIDRLKDLAQASPSHLDQPGTEDLANLVADLYKWSGDRDLSTRDKDPRPTAWDKARPSLEPPGPDMDVPESSLAQQVQSLTEALEDQGDSEESQSLEEESQTNDGDSDDWKEKLKDDLEGRYEPYIKEQALTSGQGDKKGTSFSSPLAHTEQEDQRQVQQASPQETFSEEPVDVEVDAIDRQAEDQLRRDGHRGAGASSTGLTKMIHSQRKWLAQEVDYLRASLANRISQVDFGAMVDKAVAAIDHFNEATATLNMSGASVNQLDFDDVISLYQRFKKPQFVAFVNKVGRNKLYARQLQYKKKRSRSVPVERVVSSHHLDLMIEDELMGLSLDIEAFENDFYDRYLRDDLLTFELIDQQDKRKGPIILCYDGSGSMEGKKIEETQAHILSIMEIARIQKRKLVLIQFASATEPMYIKEINPLMVNANDVLEVLDTFICGGTDFEKPLSKAMEFVQKDHHRKSDILFITDGQCEIRQAFQDKFMTVKQERQFRLYTIIMHSYTYQDYGDIGRISDDILDIRGQDAGNWNEETNKRLYTMI